MLICLMPPPQPPGQLVYRQSLSHRPVHVITSAPPPEPAMQLIQLVRLGPHSFRKLHSSSFGLVQRRTELRRHRKPRIARRNASRCGLYSKGSEWRAVRANRHSPV